VKKGASKSETARRFCVHRPTVKRYCKQPDERSTLQPKKAPGKAQKDITYVRSAEGFAYLAFILHACSRREVGWSMATHLRTELVVDALQMAIVRRKPAPGLVHHSDRGVQYTSLSFSKSLEDEGLIPSMGWVGSAYDNTLLAEFFVATLKTELLYRISWRTRQAVRTAIFEHVEGYYNSRRRHSSLGHLSPAVFEEVKVKAQDGA
jgi:transposase InsO family protein